jgi:hypothetical protein
MAKFTFNGDETLIYSDIDGASLEAVPGETYDISAAPDTLWTPAGSAPSAPNTPVEPTEAPVEPANPTA